jgi:hypothetical protein
MIAAIGVALVAIAIVLIGGYFALKEYKRRNKIKKIVSAATEASVRIINKLQFRQKVGSGSQGNGNYVSWFLTFFSF